jgi:hypothetical protein
VIEEKVKEKKKQMREDERRAKELLKLTVEKGRNRPMLYEQSSVDMNKASNLAFLKATEKFIKCLEEAGEKDIKRYVDPKYYELKEEEDVKERLRKQHRGTI